MKEVMEIDISFVAATISLTLIFIFGWYSYKAEPKIEIPDISRFPFNESTGKERSFVNKTSDTSLWTEITRRKVIGKTYRPTWECGVQKTIKETTHTTGSTSGVVEAYFLSAFGRVCPPVCDEIIYTDNDGGPILDGNGTYILDGNE
jgi:hypothetical protein